MREAIAHAKVGDDGYGEDPTIQELETTFARLVEKQAALFVPSGVMANQIAVRVLTQPGDVIVAGRHQHVVAYEMGASSRNASVQFSLVDDANGVLCADDVAEIIDSELDHQPHVSLVAVENTHMYSGGIPWSAHQMSAFADAVAGRPLHLDGARLFNAVVATGDSAANLARPATTVLVSLSKGLCAPVGSLLAGPSELIGRARIERKRLGGAMRQAGFLAAAGLVALTMVDRLADDHRRAQLLAQCVATRFPESEYDPATCRTNIVSFDHPRARSLVSELTDRGLLGGTVGPQRARFVTHADVDDSKIERACAVIEAFRWS